MPTITTRYFGETTYTEDYGADFDKTEIYLNNKTSLCDVSIFENLNEAKLAKGIMLLDSLEELDAKARKEMLADYQSDTSIVYDFIDEHFNEYGDEIRDQIFAKLNISTQDNDKFLENLELGSITLYDDANKGVCITLDYNLIWDEMFTFTDQILAVNFNAEKQCVGIAHES